MIENLKQALERIAELERKIESQEIVISALVAEVKKVKETEDSSKQQERSECKNIISECLEKNEYYCESKAENEYIKKMDDRNVSFEEDVEGIFKSKKAQKPFKEAFTVDSFIAYCRDMHSFGLISRSDGKSKKMFRCCIKQYVEKVTRHLMVNLNVYDLNTLCSAFNLLCAEMEYNHKLVIAHDIILLVDDFSRMPFIVSAVFNNQGIHSDVLGETVSNIVMHQCDIDSEMYSDSPNLVRYYARISANFGNHTDVKPLGDICSDLIGDIHAFEDGEINEAIFPRMYSIRALCHYMDWDYSYNEFVCGVLYPRLVERQEALCAVYMFSVVFNALRVFGEVESVKMSLEKLKGMIHDDSELSAVCYMFVKQIDPDCAEQWFRMHGDRVKSVSAKYLKDVLIY
ncbi:hypothetical protein CWI42_040240 [Ordospora colligata]|uniref:Uncharacterized protein n=1 Tax=Ordospora colligata OC4 TaxID=1354746 RepID=A0A0B2ULD0_9MICR|nr:uncharacterized protein M896_040240 [Ordospora colligata OC4]KHN69832.1 hypothetical protein M896_040240 [Ordospora colligata OC4]TBU16002.1 hypothetical protein CWI41_040240 [Ordospora colligata]TBU16215.1 hypothetical protein CWI40_040240 [Ordospora colligata]TBU18919.1 hypothetical protein CWI42_040240 [Ordospora colligata]